MTAQKIRELLDGGYVRHKDDCGAAAWEQRNRVHRPSYTRPTCTCGLDTMLKGTKVQETIVCSINKVREGEQNDGPLKSTDLFIRGRGIQVLVNIDAGGEATYSLLADGQDLGNGFICQKDDH